MAGKRALIVIDMINDFVSKGGVLVVPAARDIIPCIKREIEKARAEGYPVIYLADNHSEDDPEFEQFGPHALEGTWGSRVIEELAPKEGERIISKKRFSGFYQTELDPYIKELDVKTLILTGTLTNICIYFTAADARNRGLRVIVKPDCIASLSKETDKTFLAQMKTVLGVEIPS